jgi:tRNA acetyltransferase TAN1
VKKFVLVPGGVRIGSTEKFDMVVKFNGESKHEDDELLGIEELECALKDMSSDLYIKESECLDIVLVELGTDSVEVAKKLRNSPTKIISRVVPINMVIESHKEAIIKKIKELSQGISLPGDTFSVNCTVMNSDTLESTNLKKLVVEELCNIGLNYHEDKPKWMIYVEVIGKNTGLSVLKFADI